MELVSRNPEELYALMCLVGDLLPALPTDGLFSVDQWLFRIYPRVGAPLVEYTCDTFRWVL